MENTKDSVWKKINRGAPEECWEWQGERAAPQNYGRIRIGGRKLRVHRVVWEISNGIAIPEGMMICHRCDNPPCCNPSHLFMGTQSDNMYDMYSKKRKAPMAGEINPRTKYPDQTIREIRELWQTGNWKPRELARKFNISAAYISEIIHYHGRLSA